VRTRISDHRVWPAFATATYIVCSGDAAILDESAALFGHCARGLVQGLELTGEMGLPLISTGGWTWYAGTAGWMYRAGIEGILGIRRKGAFLIVDPCIPISWPRFSVTIAVESTHYQISVENSSQRGRGISPVFIDEEIAEFGDVSARVSIDGGTHRLRIFL
jgi:cellobiose phosphorylase